MAVERKSLENFGERCGSERERFQRELGILRGWPVTAVIDDASWADLESGNLHGKLLVNQVQGSFFGWIAQGLRTDAGMLVGYVRDGLH